MADSRLRELERAACGGDRQAMAKLLVEEARQARGPGLATCLSRGTHRWVGSVIRGRAIGSFIGMDYCLDCEATEIQVRRRPIDSKCPPNGLAVGQREITQYSVGQGGFHRALRFEGVKDISGRNYITFRSLCGNAIQIGEDQAISAWADAVNDPRCGACARAAPERREEAMRAGPALHERLREFAKNFRPSPAYYEERPLDEGPPRAWVNGQWLRKAPDLKSIHTDTIEVRF